MWWQYGGFFFKVYPGGLNTNQWIFCLACALGVLAWQQLINLAARFFGDTDVATGGSSGEGGMLKFKSMFGNGNVEFAAPTSGRSEVVRIKSAAVGRVLSRGNSARSL